MGLGLGLVGRESGFRFCNFYSVFFLVFFLLLDFEFWICIGDFRYGLEGKVGFSFVFSILCLFCILSLFLILNFGFGSDLWDWD